MYVLNSIFKNQILRFAGDLVPNRKNLGMDLRPEVKADALRGLTSLLGSAKPRVDGGTLIELGVGRTPDLMVAFAVCGAAKVLGLDVSTCLNEFPVTRERFQAVLALLASPQHANFVECFAGKGGIKTDFEACRSAVRALTYGGSTIPADDATIDLIYSKSVLEHVRKSDVRTLLRDQLRVLRPGGLVCHTIDLRDHCFIRGDDVQTGDWLDALRYSERVHNLMTSHRPGYINRIRAEGWRRHFEEAGFEFLKDEVRRCPLPKNFAPHSLDLQFRSSSEDFSIGWISVVARKPL